MSELRDAFWNTPRLSLLPGGDSDLRQAIYQAVREGRLRIVRAGGETVVVNDPSEINFNAPTYRLAKPEAATEPSSGARPGTKGGGQGGTDGHAAGGSGQGVSGQDDRPSPMERMFAITIMKNLVSDPDAADNLAQLFRRLFDLLDRRDISYLQATLQVQLPPEQADEIAELARSLGFPATIRDR